MHKNSENSAFEVDGSGSLHTSSMRIHLFGFANGIFRALVWSELCVDGTH